MCVCVSDCIQVRGKVGVRGTKNHIGVTLVYVDVSSYKPLSIPVQCENISK